MDAEKTIQIAHATVQEARRLPIGRLMLLVVGAAALGGSYFFADAWWRQRNHHIYTVELVRTVAVASAAATEAANRAGQLRAKEVKAASVGAGDQTAPASSAGSGAAAGPALKVESEVKIVENIIEATFALVPLPDFERRVFFPQGKYDLRHAYEQSEFISAVIGMLHGVYAKYTETEVPADIVFSGSADGVGKGAVTSVTYEGEFGNLSQPNVLINGEARSVAINKGKQVTNAELAFLRAAAVKAAFDQIYGNQRAKLKFDSMKFIATESDQTGKDYRYGRITIRFKPLGGAAPSAKNAATI